MLQKVLANLAHNVLHSDNGEGTRKQCQVARCAGRHARLDVFLIRYKVPSRAFRGNWAKIAYIYLIVLSEVLPVT